MINRLLFSLWYLGRPPWDSGISPPELLDFIKDHPPGRALDLGCGTGTNVLTLAQAGWDVTGVDFIWFAIWQARRKLNKAGKHARLLVADVTHLNVNAEFDLALDIGCFHGVTDHEAYLKSLQDHLRPGGHWLMYGFFKSGVSSPGPGLTDRDIDQIRKRLEFVWRQDGTDKFERPSSWFLFQKPNPQFA